LSESSVLQFLIGYIYRRLNEADPTREPVKYQYSIKTSTSSLRPHIEANHLELYKKLAKERGWEILLPGLVSQARSAAAGAGTVSRQREKFSVGAFYRLLVNFIVADDQVCFCSSWSLHSLIFLSCHNSQVPQHCGVSRVQAASAPVTRGHRRGDTTSDQNPGIDYQRVERVRWGVEGPACGTFYAP
jgi:hypothetical protein